jgi:DNA-binding CsgD family transcriptional regulator
MDEADWRGAAGEGVSLGHAYGLGPRSLTPQEWQIAQLAAAGLTNKQIGERLFLSHRTVAAHLYRLFPRLGITSRAALRDALGESVREQPAQIRASTPNRAPSPSSVSWYPRWRCSCSDSRPAASRIAS